MLQSVNDLKGYTITTADGEIGSIVPQPVRRYSSRKEN